MDRRTKIYSFLNTVALFVVAISAKAAPDLSGTPGIDLTIQSLFGILTGLACWMSRFVIVIMVAAIIWYGIQFLISQGDPGKFTSAKKSINYAIIGIVVVLGAYTIISTVGTAVQGAGDAKTNKFQWDFNNFVPLDCSNSGAVTGG